MDKMFTVLITGASRGIGCGIVQELLHKSHYRVIATCRDPKTASKLQHLARIYSTQERFLIFPLDINSEESHQQLKVLLAQHGISSIDILFANAGILSERDHAIDLSIDNVRKDFETNVIGSILTLQAYKDLVLASKLKLFAITSSNLGSLTWLADNENLGNVSYRVSKAALNMFSLSFACEISSKVPDCKTLLIHPGWVQTDMGGETAPISLAHSTTGIMGIIETATLFQVKDPATTVDSLPTVYQPLYRRLQEVPIVYVTYEGELVPW